MKYRHLTTIVVFLTALFLTPAFAADATKEFVPDDDKGPDIGAAPTSTGSDSTDKTEKTIAKKKTDKEFVPDDDKGPDIGAAPTK